MLVKNLGINDRIHIVGLLNRREVAELLNSVNAFALLSTNETFGVSYIEALACGCPVLATRNGGAEEIVNSDNGIIVEVDDTEMIIDALKTIKKKYFQYNLQNISNNCIEMYSENTIYNKTIEIYNRLICKSM